MMNEPQDKSINKAGRTMAFIAWVLGLGLIALWFQNYLDDQSNPNKNPSSYKTDSSVEVVLNRNRYGHYVSNGTINGFEVVLFLDTGATYVSVPEKVARQIGLKKGGRYRVQTANGSVEVFSTIIDELTIGNISLRDVKASINPHMEGEEILLGMSALKQVEFTQRGEQLTLKSFF